MSINFKRELSSNEMQAFAEIMQDDVSVMDAKTALLEPAELNTKKMNFLANKLKQPLTVELNDEGDIKTMLDGTRYRCTAKGWMKI